MARRFRGESNHKVDAKGRVSIPAAYRRVLEAGDPEWTDGLFPNLILVYGGKGRKFIEGYTIEAMNDVEARIERMPLGSKERRIAEHTLLNQSQQVQVDLTGRLVLTQKMRDLFGITGEAVFAAAGTTFQIWDPATYEVNTAQLDEWYDEEDNIDPLTLLPALPVGQ